MHTLNGIYGQPKTTTNESILDLRSQDPFKNDNFTGRRTTGHNLYDPESLITGEEVAAGMTYDNSRRFFKSPSHYRAAISGKLTPAEIAETAPRTKVSQ